MQAPGVCSAARIFAALIFMLLARTVVAAQSAALDVERIAANVGGVELSLFGPPGQQLGAVALEPLFALHDVSGDGLRALAVYMAGDTRLFFEGHGHALPAQGLMSTLIITERALESRHVDERALRDVLVAELNQQRQLQGFLATWRFGPRQSRLSLPDPRLLAVEDFLILEGRERLLPQSGRRISYCVEAFLALRNRPILASTCLAKPEVSRRDMHLLEMSVGAWTHSLLTANASSRSATRLPAGPDAADFKTDAGTGHSAAVNLRLAAEHRRADVLMASTLLSAQLPAALRKDLDRSNQRFMDNVTSICGRVRDVALGYQCRLVAFDRRLRALEECTPQSVAALLHAESVEAPAPLPSI
jgi:hypothetical protein